MWSLCFGIVLSLICDIEILRSFVFEILVSYISDSWALF